MVEAETGKPPETSPQSELERASEIPPGAPPFPPLGSAETSASPETSSETAPNAKNFEHANNQTPETSPHSGREGP
eukprot:1315212-Pyramimonas_sp.AAC.1